MASIGWVWDRTTQVLAGRGSTVAGIAAVAIFLPTVVRAAYTAYAPATPANAVIGAMLSLVILFVTIWGQLAIIALSSDPANARADATRVATRRLPVAIGVVVVVGIALTLLLVPAFVAVGRSFGPSSFALMQAGVMPKIAPGAAQFATLYLAVLAIALLFLGARLFVMNPVIVNERLGLGSIRRAFDLTRGWTWRLVGLLILYAVVLLVAMGAAQAVVGVVFRLLLGPNGIATASFLGAVAGGAVTAALSVVATVFAAQLYVATRGDVGPV